MANEIIITGKNEFSVTTRGMTLVCKPSIINSGEWDVIVDSAMVRAYKTMGLKTFATLEAVQKHYKSFRGLVDMVADLAAVEAAPVVVVEAPKAITIDQKIEAVRRLAKQHGIKGARRLKLKRQLVTAGKQGQWLTLEQFKGFADAIHDLGFRVAQLDTLIKNSRYPMKNGSAVMVDTITIELG
jgi:hypothetical protein